MNDDLVYWLALSERRGIFPNLLLFNIIKRHGSLKKFCEADKKDIIKSGLSERETDRLMKYINKVDLETYRDTLKLIKKDNIDVIRYVDRERDKEYPYSLTRSITKIYNPPIILLRKGKLDNFNRCVGIVGNRNASHYARNKAREFARTLARKGYTIVSGMARGIDYEAHAGALDVKNGKTVAVLAGMEPIYPPEHLELSNDIIRNGCILSETYHARARAYTFIERNRLISGISSFIIAVESGYSGGTQRQIDLAIEQQKPVYTIKPPHTVSKEKHQGYKIATKKGVETVRDVEELLWTRERIRQVTLMDT